VALERFRLLRRNVDASYLVRPTCSGDQRNAAQARQGRKPWSASSKPWRGRARDHSRLSKESSGRGEARSTALKLPARQRPSFDTIDDRIRRIRAAETDLMQHVNLLRRSRTRRRIRRKKKGDSKSRGQVLEKDAGWARPSKKKFTRGYPRSSPGRSAGQHLAPSWRISGKPRACPHKKARRRVIYEEPGRLWTRNGMATRFKEARTPSAECRGVRHDRAAQAAQANEQHAPRSGKEAPR